MSNSPLVPVSGSQGRMQVSGTNINLSYHKITEHVDDQPATNFESAVDPDDGATFKEGHTCAKWCSIEFRGLWDSEADQFEDPPGLSVGLLPGPVKFFLDKDDPTACWNFSAIRILECSTETDAQSGAVKFAGRGESQGSYFTP